MSEWKSYYSILRCLKCSGNLSVNNAPKKFNQYPLVNGELFCPSCTMRYPIYQDIPVMFKDNDRTKILIDSAAYEAHLKKSEKRMQQATPPTIDELNQSNDGNGLTDAFNWVIFFWEKWKQSDRGFIEYNREQLEEYLEQDRHLGGKLRFFNRILFFNKDFSGKRLLNIGAGRDFILEKFLEKEYEVISPQ